MMGLRPGDSAFADILHIDIDTVGLPRCLHAGETLGELRSLYADLAIECRKPRLRNGKPKAIVSGLSPAGPQRLDWQETEAPCNVLPTQNPGAAHLLQQYPQT